MTPSEAQNPRSKDGVGLICTSMFGTRGEADVDWVGLGCVLVACHAYDMESEESKKSSSRRRKFAINLTVSHDHRESGHSGMKHGDWVA